MTDLEKFARFFGIFGIITVFIALCLFLTDIVALGNVRYSPWVLTLGVGAFVLYGLINLSASLIAKHAE